MAVPGSIPSTRAGLDAPAREVAPSVRHAVLAGSIGNFTEQYEFGVYGYLAPVLAPLFFPSGSHLLSLLSTYGAYAISFAARPIGGVVFGSLSDRIGRRQVLSITIVLIGLFTGLIGVLPTHASVGVWAPILLVALRLCQGIAAGGEYAGAVDYIVEHAPPGRRGLFASFASLGVYAGLLCGAGMATLITGVLSDHHVDTWGWRIPFVVAFVISLVGLYLRRRATESPEFLRESAGGAAPEPTPLRTTLTTQRKAILIYIGLTLGGSVSGYTVITYLPQYLSGDVGLSSFHAFLTSVIAMGVLLPTIPLTGMLVDRVGRKPVLMTAAGLYIVMPFIAYAIATAGGLANALIAELLFMIPVSLSSAAVTVLIPEMFPTRVRGAASGIGFNVSYGLFGGTAPLMGTLLYSTFHTVTAVAAYGALAASVTLVVAILFMRETRDTTLAETKF